MIAVTIESSERNCRGDVRRVRPALWGRPSTLCAPIGSAPRLRGWAVAVLLGLRLIAA
jgi:hypothetical protein